MKTAYRDDYPEATRRFFSRVLTASVAVQLLGTGLAVYHEWRGTFSGAWEVASALRRRGLQDAPIAVHPDYTGSAIAGYLGRPLYYPATQRSGTFVKWTRDRHYLLANGALEAARVWAAPSGKDLVFVSNSEIPGRPWLFRTGDSATGDETFWVYQVPAERQGR